MPISALKQPSAWLPVAMSFTALAIVIIHIAIFGVVREADEGTAAHLFQILMAGQIPLIGFFAIKWLPRNPADGLKILVLQAVAAIAAFMPVYLLHL